MILHLKRLAKQPLCSTKVFSLVKPFSTAIQRSDLHGPSGLNGNMFEENHGDFLKSHDASYHGNGGLVGHNSGEISLKNVRSNNIQHDMQNIYHINKGEISQQKINVLYGQKDSQYMDLGNGCYGQIRGHFPQNASYNSKLESTLSSPKMPSGNCADVVVSQHQNHNFYPGISCNSQSVSEHYCDDNKRPVTNWYPERNVLRSNEDLGENMMMQNASGSHLSSAAYNDQSSSEFQNKTQDPFASTNLGPDSQSAESSPAIGTIEQFDNYCREEKLEEAIEILGLLEQQGVLLDITRYLALMKLCGDAKSLQEAKLVHEHVIRSIPHIEISTYNIILEMYSKCGSMDDAFSVFKRMPQRNLTSWDTMITWLARNGLGEDAIDMFTQFKSSGLKPDAEIFFGVFSACAMVGDIDEGLLHFESMRKDYGIVPSMKHYASVIEMLGSTGYLDEAFEFIENMPMEPTVDVWEIMMNLCRVHGNMELGDRCAELIELLDSSRLNEQSKAGLVPMQASKNGRVKLRMKQTGQNPLEVRSRVHEYRAGDTSHPENHKLYTLLRGLRQQMKEAGYVPETKFVLHDIDQEGKEDALLGHSERLAVAQGLLTSSARFPLRIIKNLRVCGDCHNALKIISKLVGRELIIRDAKRFHHFKDGLCSCRDYW